MRCVERPDDFERRRKKLQGMSDEELHHHFWNLVEKIVKPVIEEARSHTTSSIERSILLRMGFSSIEANALVAKILEQNLLGHGAGRLILELAKAKQLSIHETGTALLAGQYWEELPV